VPYTELKRRIVEVDEENLEVAQLEQLIRYMPEPEQMSQLAALKDEYDTLSEAEQFGVVVCNILCVILLDAYYVLLSDKCFRFRSAVIKTGYKDPQKLCFYVKRLGEFRDCMDFCCNSCISVIYSF